MEKIKTVCKKDGHWCSKMFETNLVIKGYRTYLMISQCTRCGEVIKREVPYDKV